MNDKNKTNLEENNKKKENSIKTGLNKKRESLISQRGKMLLKKIKAKSVRNGRKQKKKININISQNININTNNIKGLEKCNSNVFSNDIRSKHLETKIKGNKMKSCIYGPRKKFSEHKLYNSGHLSVNEIQSKEDEFSNKMDKSFLKNTKIESRDTKEDQFIEFYINDNKKNIEYHLKNNNITTTKYNFITFLPKGLFYQFSRLSNVYFLFTAIIQSIPIISPLTSLTAIVPLIFVLGVSMIREIIEDLSRHNYDNLNNGEEVIVLRENKFVKAMSSTLRHGEIILLYENKSIPADMILIDSCFSEGTCYVETSSLDGEKTLKLKISNKYTQGFISNDINVKNNKNIEKFIQGGKYFFGGYIKINSPNADLNYVNGTIHALFQKNGEQIEQDIALSTNEFLLKGSILKNTNWIIGIVVYTGMSNKIILNSKKPRMKMSKVEKKLNYYLLFIFVFLIACCSLCSINHHFHYYNHQKFYENFILMENDPNTESFINFFTYFLLLNTMIPISLIVSTEIIKLIQGIFMTWDIFLYSKWRHCFCGAKSVSIIEELGNVNFIFSDKTGTLTKNQLQFKYCIIENKIYEYLKMAGDIKKNSSLFLKSKKKKSKYSLMNIYANRKSETYSKINHDLANNSKLLLNQEDSSFIEDDDYNKIKNIESKSVTVINKKQMPESNTQLNKMNVNIIPTNNKKDNFNTFIVKKNFLNLQYNNKESNNFLKVNDSRLNESKINDSQIDDSISKNNDIFDNNFKKSTRSIRSISANNIKKVKNKTKNENNSEFSDDSNDSNSDSNDISHRGGQNYNKKNDDQMNNVRNSTILEAKNEENESITSLNEIIKFGEGFFAMEENNPHLKKSFKAINEEDFDFIHEFWKALSITNECMIKDDKGDIKYMGTSPDDLELVKVAALQGYKLIETSINTKTVRISGRDHTYEVLKVIGFSSERKRMSIIVRDELGIRLYTKGADCEISKRLSKKSLESESYSIISNGLIEFSKRGFRSLMVACRRINEEDYNSWVNRLHEDELNNEHKKVIDKLYDIIENNLMLIGGTVVEDKLQDKVPETIKEIRTAGIKVWVLTGDKLDTAENIGRSCNLLTKEQKLFTLKVMPGDDEKAVKENPYPEMIQFFSEFQEFIENLVKKYNLDTKYSKKNRYRSNLNNDNFESLDNIDNYNVDVISEFSNQEQKSSYESNISEQSKIIDFETFKYLRDKKILEPFSIIIEAPILCGLFKDEEWTENFLNIAYNSNTVICCRVSPFQKSQVIQKMKNFDKSAVTLAIGDGGNDVSMIMEANIGIGIYGEEGMSAAQASDFSIGEFQLLKRLLFFHGRINLYRISKMILYFFFKNFVFTMIQLYYSFACLSSGQTFVDDWYITCYNLIFTAFPLCISALSDTDINLKDEKEKKNSALLYRENRDKYKIFSFKGFLCKLVKGIIYSLIIFSFCFLNEILVNGRNKNIWYLSLKSYTCVLIMVSSNLLISNNFVVYLLPLSIGITTFFLFMVFLIINHFGFFFYFNSKASIELTFTSLITYLHIIIICSFGFLFDYIHKLIIIFFSKSLTSKLMLRRGVKADRKSSHDINKLMNSKSYSNKVSKKKPIKRNSLNYDGSKSILLLRASNKLNTMNEMNNAVNTPKAFNNSKYKVGPDYKNDFFSLRLKKFNANNEDKSKK